VKLPLTDEEGRFYGPEEAAFHACMVQGGFSTPQREAARMLLAGGVSEQRALSWMTAQHLTEDGLEWDPGQLDRYRARKGTGGKSHE
jgi:hypothetical protein